MSALSLIPTTDLVIENFTVRHRITVANDSTESLLNNTKPTAIKPDIIERLPRASNGPIGDPIPDSLKHRMPN